jgi:hypothetical protein
VTVHIEAVSYAIEVVNSLVKEYSTYRIARAKLLIQICTHPYNEDLRAAFLSSDIDQFNSLKHLIPSVVNVFISTYDTLGKNISKIKNPRGTEPKSWMY